MSKVFIPSAVSKCHITLHSATVSLTYLLGSIVFACFCIHLNCWSRKLGLFEYKSGNSQGILICGPGMNPVAVDEILYTVKVA